MKEKIMRTKACIDCDYSCPRKPIKTFMEQWEEDKRPERPKGFWGLLQWLYNPNKFKLEKPYKEEDNKDNIYKHLDLLELVDRKNAVTCTLHPKWKKVNKNHFCGNYRWKHKSEIVMRGGKH